MTIRNNLRRWHVWLGWLVGLPLLLWALSGFVMILKPIEETRGAELLAPPSAVRLTAPPVLPSEVAGLPLASVSLEQRAAGPRWVIELAAGPARLADPLTGRFLQPFSATDATAEVRARWQGEGSIASVTRTSADSPPLDFRRPVEAWQVRMTDGTHIYVDAATGGILATRTRWWRIYDFMWGIHIMDLRGREDTHHPLLLGFAGLSLVALLLSLVLLPLSTRRRKG
jgi:hypothetical protein